MRWHLRQVTRSMALPFGFTVTVSSAVVSLAWRWPDTRVWEIWLFCAGAVAGHALLSLLSRAARQEPRPLSDTVNVAPLVVVPIVSLAPSVIEVREIAFFTVGVLVTGLYLTASAALGSSVDAIRRVCRQSGDE